MGGSTEAIEPGDALCRCIEEDGHAPREEDLERDEHARRRRAVASRQRRRALRVDQVGQRHQRQGWHQHRRLVCALVNRREGAQGILLPAEQGSG